MLLIYKNMEIRKLIDKHWDQVKIIYQKGIDTGNAASSPSSLHGKNGIVHIWHRPELQCRKITT